MLKLKSLLFKLWNESQTVALSTVQAVSAGVLFLSGLLNDSTVNSALHELNLPVWFPFFLIGLAAVTYVAHGHADDA